VRKITVGVDEDQNKSINVEPGLDNLFTGVERTFS